MAGRSRFSIAKQDIVAVFDAAPEKVYDARGISRILGEHRALWRLAGSMTVSAFIGEMLSKTSLRKVRIGSYTRYVYRPASLYEIVATLKPRSYFSHFSAAYLHQLTLQLPKTLYLTSELSKATGAAEGPVGQEEIDRAFSKPQRVTKNCIGHEGFSVCLLNGKHTGRAGTELLEHPEEGLVPVTGLERTLVDLAVRPVYSGGVGEVLDAYAAARERVSVNKLNALLGKLDFAYPYHQAIGFYMERAGYRDAQLALLEKRGMHHDFYLTYAMKETAYSKRWRLYYPEGF